jgi:hypothetical protein
MLDWVDFCNGPPCSLLCYVLKFSSPGVMDSWHPGCYFSQGINVVVASLVFNFLIF